MYKDLIDGSTRVIFIFNIISKRALRNRHNDKNVIAFSKNMIANLKSSVDGRCMGRRAKMKRQRNGMK